MSSLLTPRCSPLASFFFRTPLSKTTTWEIVNWWESRRAAYNLAVGAAGMITLAMVALFTMLPPHPLSLSLPWPLIVLYGLAANIAYTAGPVIDVAICKSWGDDYAAVGPALFRYGFAFSIGLTLLPIPLAVAGWFFRAVQVLL